MFYWSVVSLDRAVRVFSPTSTWVTESWISGLKYSTVSRCFPSLSLMPWLLRKRCITDFSSSHIWSRRRWISGPSFWKKQRNFLKIGSTDTKKASWAGKDLSCNFLQIRLYRSFFSKLLLVLFSVACLGNSFRKYLLTASQLLTILSNAGSSVRGSQWG